MAAEWVGPQQIKLTNVKVLRVVDRYRFPRAMLLEQGQKAYYYRTRDLKPSL